MTTYVNQGPDKRAGGWIGQLGAIVQRALSFYSDMPPKTFLVKLADGGHISFSWPLFISVFVYRGDGRWRSVRAGWRHDPNWGDGNHPTEPKRVPPGGYIADVIIKMRINNVVVND